MCKWLFFFFCNVVARPELTLEGEAKFWKPACTRSKKKSFQEEKQLLLKFLSKLPIILSLVQLTVISKIKCISFALLKSSQISIKICWPVAVHNVSWNKKIENTSFAAHSRSSFLKACNFKILIQKTISNNEKCNEKF